MTRPQNGFVGRPGVCLQVEIERIDPAVFIMCADPTIERGRDSADSHDFGDLDEKIGDLDRICRFPQLLFTQKENQRGGETARQTGRLDRRRENYG